MFRRFRTILSGVLLASLALMSTSHGEGEDYCAMCMISKTKKLVCYTSKGKNDAHQVGHLLNLCGIDPCVRALGMATRDEAKKENIPIQDASRMSKVKCD